MNAQPASVSSSLPAPTRRRSGLVLAVEIGGTTTRLACFAGPANAISPIVRLPTPNYLTRPGLPSAAILSELRESIWNTARELLGSSTPDGVVVAWPGPVTPEGLVLRSPTILGPESDRSDDIGQGLRALWPSSQVRVLNDLTAAGYHFVQQGHTDFCVITVGSGIGNKVFLRARPYVGSKGFGGEIGHLTMSPQPETPVSSLRRELGQIASGRGTRWLADLWDRGGAFEAASSGLRETNADDEANVALVTDFRAGDARAQAIVRAAAHPLALAIGGLHLGLGLTRFFIIGGFAKALGEDYRVLLVDWCCELTWDVGQQWNEMLELGVEGIDEGLLGAASYGAQVVRMRGRKT